MTRSTRFTTLLLMLSLILLPQTSQGAPYRITVLATNISDYGGLGALPRFFGVSKMQFYSIPALKRTRYSTMCCIWASICRKSRKLC